MRILLVEDDDLTSQALDLVLRREGWVVDPVRCGEDCLDFARTYDYDLMIIDLSLPDMDGLDLIRKIRATRIQTPVLILSGYTEADRKVQGLGLGADDYVTKPYDRLELVARIQAIVRRSMGHSRSVLMIGNLEIDLDAHTARTNGTVIPLTGKEYAILELLALRKGTTLTKEQFLNHLYGGMDEPDLKIIDVFVCKLRKKLSQHLGGVNYIETVWGRGYMLRDQPDAPAVPPVSPDSVVSVASPAASAPNRPATPPQPATVP